MTKKMLAAVVALSSVAILAGCGTNNTPTPEVENVEVNVDQAMQEAQDMIENMSDAEIQAMIDSASGAAVDMTSEMIVVEQPAEAVLVDETVAVENMQDAVEPAAADEVAAQ